MNGGSWASFTRPAVTGSGTGRSLFPWHSACASFPADRSRDIDESMSLTVGIASVAWPLTSCAGPMAKRCDEFSTGDAPPKGIATSGTYAIGEPPPGTPTC